MSEESVASPSVEPVGPVAAPFLPFRSREEMEAWESGVRSGAAAECARRMRKGPLDYALIVVFCTLLVFAGAFSYHRFFSLRVYTMNLAPMVDAKVKEIQARKGTADPEAAQKEVFEYLDSLKAYAETIAAEKRGVVLVTQAVISGATDITGEVKAKLEKPGR